MKNEMLMPKNEKERILQSSNLTYLTEALRKGSNYRKIAKEFGVGDRDLRIVFSGILSNGLRYLEFLIAVVRGDQLKK